MNLNGHDRTRSDLLRRVGHLGQVAGIEVLSFEEGHARGMRAVEVSTGTGFRFRVMPDRGMDVGQADYRGLGLGWMQPKGLAAPSYYEGDYDPHSWLRVGVGGLFNTAGLVSIGTPVDLDTSSFGFTQRLTARYGTHDRIALTPASTFAHGERWEGDRCILWVEGVVRQDIAYGENLALRRRYETEIGSDAFTMRDVVTNEGWYPTRHQLLYHFNIGHPIVDTGARIVASARQEPAAMDYSTAGDTDNTGWREVTDPVPGFTFEAYTLDMSSDLTGHVAVGVVNRGTRPETGGTGVYLKYDKRQLPTYITWRMMREGLYAVGLEPATNDFGQEGDGIPALLRPGESRTYDLEFGILEDGEAIDAFLAAHDDTETP